MKPRTFFGIALLTPYILWIISALLAYLLSGLEISSSWNILLMPVMFYAIGILLWFIPYTLLAIGLWIWSRKKSVKTLFRAALVSPFLLGFLMIVEGVWVNLPVDNLSKLANELPGQAAMLGILSLFFGYLCVGIAFGVYKVLQARNRIADESTPPQTA